MRVIRVMLVVIVTCSAVLFVASTFGQGSLTPPGAPAPTMKTLQEVEPRIPVTNLSYTISAPGSYYLTTNLASTGHGVVIQTSGVTLDLMGFSLTGDRNGDDYGVLIDGATNAPRNDVVVRNGIIGRFGQGVRCEYGRNCRLERLVISSNLVYGVSLYGVSLSGKCNGNTVANCSVSGNGSDGIHLDGSDSGQCNGSIIADCTLNANSAYGVYLNGVAGQCNGNAVVDCNISGNGGSGIVLSSAISGQCNGNTIAGCTVSGNGPDGGVYLCGNATSGECDGNSVANCTIRGNYYKGIYLYYADENRIENNHISAQTGNPTYGIRSFVGSRNLILRNTCVGQTNNYDVTSDDTYGPIVTNSGALSGTDPWANFSR